MASRWIAEQKKIAAAKAKHKAEREAARKAKLPVRSPNCEVCNEPTRNFNARINIRTEKGNLLTIGICGDCVHKGYTFDKEANIIQRAVNVAKGKMEG